ncbi:MAG: tRNA glutamyl-Q(34) synthetase GluQRS [Cyanobacteriota bacterium]|nr:tRNA glutamyl-Q(34) synthetase GluQRS [Cyanobacteriota bacterium]
MLPASLQDRLALGLQLRQQGVCGRFAPSPSGRLHLGNLRTALLSWLDARRSDGRWLLRIDDLDRPRVRPDAEASILEDLRWLGLHWDGPVIRQSERRGLYTSVLSWLRRSGRLYPCHCSRRLLADISAPHGGFAPYPGTCRHLEPFWGQRQGRWPSWRLRLSEGTIAWQERWAPPGILDGPREIGDVVLRRADGVVAYHLATAVDELTLGVTDVVRGADLWASAGAQVAICQALGAPPPRYGHGPVLCDGQGQRLSKRVASEGLPAWRERGVEAPGVIGWLAASVGLVPEGSCLSARELLAEVRQRPEAWDRALRREAQAEEALESFRIPPPSQGAKGRHSV